MLRYLSILLIIFCTALLPAQAPYSFEKEAPKEAPSEIVRVVPVASYQANKTEIENYQKRFLVLVRTDQNRRSVSPIIEDVQKRVISVFPKAQDLQANRWAIFYVAVYNRGDNGNLNNKGVTNGGANSAQSGITVWMSWQKKEKAVEVAQSALLNIMDLDWKSLYRGEKVLPVFSEVPVDFFGKSAVWKNQSLPNLWNDLGVTWLKTTFKISGQYRGSDFVVLLPPVDDNDVTYFNGHRIGATNGWDINRRYIIPAKFINFGGTNELLIAEHNQHAGGGITGFGFWLGPKKEEPPFYSKTEGLFPEDVIIHESKRRVERKLGAPLPLRSMTVRDGVLEYANGGEVALWGTNYYPQSWMQYISLKDRGIDHRKAVDQDLEDIAPARLAVSGCDGNDPRRMNIIRIHVFDTEISDSKGNLIRNDHLDILDYLTARCMDHGLYLWLTPMAWWGSPCGRPDAFSMQIPIPAMTLLSETRSIQINYVNQFLTHVNPYTKRRLVDEPCLALFEILNETLYWSYPEIIGREKPFRFNSSTPLWIEKVRSEWEKTLPDSSWKSPQAWDFYCYQQVRNYIDQIRAAIRSSGGQQPVSYHGSNWSSKTPIFWAIADSQCEAVTLNYYSGLTQTPIADKKSRLGDLVGDGLPRQFEKKARLVYEFDASDTLFQIDLYPAIARYFRELGVQAACQFQYDSRFTADRNQDWPTHYLNLIHAPHRFASFMIAGETFRTLSRGTQTKRDKNELIFPPVAVNWKENGAFCVKPDLFMQAQPSNWQPFDLPKAPHRILGTGSTPYYRYDGSGFVDLNLQKMDKNAVGKNASDVLGTLSLGPQVIRHRTDLKGTAEKPLTTLSNEKKAFILDLPGLDQVRYEDAQGKSFDGRSGLAPGEYRIKKGK